jgi:4-amino-4-deoxy-L-arabinose transferase-like glycosyltransferase
MSVAEIPPRAAPPAADRQPAAHHEPSLSAIRPARFALTFEQAAYIGLFALALLTRLWGLGDRALHHDETLHAAYSWRLYTGQGFLHDPLLHGPFLYHIVALGYFLFGDSDFTARLTTALFGSVLVVLPYLIRRELGRGAALAAATYLLISPAFLYISRFIRHDMYSVVFEMLTVVSIVRYASTRRSRWLYVGAAALGLMAANMETFYLFLVIVGSLLGLVFFWRVWKPGLLVAGALGLALVALVFVLPGKPISPAGGEVTRANGAYVCPSIGNLSPPDNPIQANPGPILGLPPLPTADNDYALCVRNQYDDNLPVYFAKLGQFFGHPAILLALALSLLGLAALYFLIWWRRDRNGMTAWELARADDDSYIRAFASLGRDPRVWLALLVFLTPYTLLFTSFFGHPSGLVSGATGSLLYWLAQHYVQRGEQPGYYYLMQLVIYEPLVLIWGIAGLVLLGTLLGRRVAAWRRDGPRFAATIDWGLAMPALLAWWALTTLALYSWAGEKMPWLTVHVALPFVLLGAWALSRALRWWAAPGIWESESGVGSTSRTPTPDPQSPAPLAVPAVGDWEAGNGDHPQSRVPDSQSPLAANGNGYTPAPRPRLWDRGLVLFLAAIGLIVTVFLIVAGSVSKPDQSEVNFVAPFLLPALLVLIGLITLFAGLLRGSRWALGALALAIVLFGSAYTFRSAYRLSYQNGDDARELLVFVQTTPDVARVVRALDAAATKRSGNLKIWYDNETVWQWYMRNFKQAQQQSPTLSAPGDDVMAVLLLAENYDGNAQNQQALQGFRIQRYPLRWWNDEYAIYRLPQDWLTAPVTQDSPLLMRVLRTPLDGRSAAQLWQYLLYRTPPARLGSTDFVLAVRPELADEIGLGTGQENAK